MTFAIKIQMCRNQLSSDIVLGYEEMSSKTVAMGIENRRGTMGTSQGDFVGRGCQRGSFRSPVLVEFTGHYPVGRGLDSSLEKSAHI